MNRTGARTHLLKTKNGYYYICAFVLMLWINLQGTNKLFSTLLGMASILLYENIFQLAFYRPDADDAAQNYRIRNSYLISLLLAQWNDIHANKLVHI